MDRERTIIDAIVKAIPDIAGVANWIPIILDHNQAELKSVVPRNWVPQVVEKAAEAIGSSQTQEAENLISVGLHLYPKRMLDEIRRSGLFRSSKYKFRANCLRRVANKIITQNTALNLSHEFVDYCNSVLRLTETAKYIYADNTAIRRFIKNRQNVFLKTIMAMIDLLFMTDHRANISLSTDKWQHYSKEELAEATSYLIHCFHSQVGVQDHHFTLMDEDALLHGKYNAILVKACKIRSFLEAEILVDAFDYSCRRGKRSIVVQPPYPKFEKSVRLGYIQQEQSEVRANAKRAEAIRSGEVSIFQMADSIYERAHDRIVQLLEEPVRRYAFFLPDRPEFTSLFSHDSFFVEERLCIEDILQSELSTWKELQLFEIRDGISVLDVLKVNRLFSFVRHIAKRHFEPLISTDPKLVYRSLVPVFREEDFRRILGWCLSADKVDTMVNLLTWTPGDSGLFDLQYKPIIRGSEYFLLPMNVAGTTNWYRNLAYTEKRRVLETVEEEAASRALAEAIGPVCKYVRKTFSTKLDGKQIEVDVVVRFGGILFVFGNCSPDLGSRMTNS